MSFISRELERLSKAIGEVPTSKHYNELYAAQQALSWAMEPIGFKAPFEMIMGIREGSEGCLVHSRLPSSSDISDAHNGLL